MGGVPSPGYPGLGWQSRPSSPVSAGSQGPDFSGRPPTARKRARGWGEGLESVAGVFLPVSSRSGTRIPPSGAFWNDLASLNIATKWLT